MKKYFSVRAALQFCLAAALTSCSTAQPMTPSLSPSPAAGQSALPDGSVEVYLTLPDQSKKLNAEPALTFSEGLPAADGQISINDQVLFQEFEGAGAAMTDSSAWLMMNALDAAAREQLLKNLFTREGDGIGLSYVRIPMGASDFALKDYTYDDMPKGQTDPALRRFNIEYDKASIIPALRAALQKNPQLRFMGSPWSPPSWMKEDFQLHGSSLLPEYYQAFADYHVRFIQAYAAEGIAIDAITPQNEPMFETDGYPTMYMPAEDQAAFIRDHLGPAIKNAGLETRILVFDHNWDMADYPLTLLSDPQAAAFVDGVAFHCYGGDVSAQSSVHNAYPDKGIWFTECSGGAWANNFGDNLSWNLQNLVIGNFNNWGKSVILWNLALDEEAGPQNGGCGDCRGVVTINQSSGEIEYNVEYYVLGHVTKFVDPGAYRVETSNVDRVPSHVAFLNPDGSLALIAQSDREVTFNVVWNGKHFSYHLPAGGAVTFKWKADVKPGATATAAPRVVPTERPLTWATGVPPQADMLLDFESPVSLYPVNNAEAVLGDIAHAGKSSLMNTSAGGQWHVTGVKLAATPLDLSKFEKICFWVFDTTSGDNGNGNNTIGVRLVDAGGYSAEPWTDHSEAGQNPRTVRDQWVQMCMNLSAYEDVDLKSVEMIEFNTYWAGDYYFDDISVQGVAP